MLDLLSVTNQGGQRSCLGSSLLCETVQKDEQQGPVCFHGTRRSLTLQLAIFSYIMLITALLNRFFIFEAMYGLLLC